MGAREDFENAVRRGDFLGAAEAWVIEPPEPGASLKAFQSKLDSSLEGRTVTIGQTLRVESGEYQYLGDQGANGARLAFLADQASLDQIEYFHNAAELRDHFKGPTAWPPMPMSDREAIVAFFAISEREAAEKSRVGEKVVESAPQVSQAHVTSAPVLDPITSLKKLLSDRNNDAEFVAMGMQVAEEYIKNDRVHVGSLVKFGTAPYLHEPENTGSFYITLREVNGHEETVWGKELQGALQASGVEAGEDFMLAHQGTTHVTVKVKERDSSGRFTGSMVDAPATRNGWTAVSLEELLRGTLERIETRGFGQEPATALGVSDAIAEAPPPVLDELGVKEPENSKAATEEQAEVTAGEQAVQDTIQPARLHKSAVDAISRASKPVDDSISQAGASASGKTQDGKAESQPAVPGPKTLLNGRFVLRDRGEYFRVADGVESKRIALVDEVSKIRFVDKQMDTFQAAIELAKHKQWEAILVTGSEKFRAEAWHHARMAGLEVIGYEPSEQDLATLKQAQEKGVARSETAAATKDPQLEEATSKLLADGYGVKPATVETGRHVGKVLHETDKHFVQDIGRQVATVHDKANFDRSALKSALEKGGTIKIQYDNGKGSIDAGKDRSKERGR
jgi:hypothetical protein